MKVTLYPDADAAYVELIDAPIAGGRTLDQDHSRRVDLDADGRARGIEFLYVSEGFEVDGIRELSAREVETLCRELTAAGLQIRTAT